MSFGEKKYHVDTNGKKWYEGLKKDGYKAGEKVRFTLPFIATDTDYKFTLDGEPFNYGYDAKEGFIFEFVMPDHDVKLKCFTRNSMTAEVTEFTEH